ncbi:dihydroneopterin aldolase [Georgenia sp. SUBG003]|uniref:dihydroneopterin aldolase n=1 Tax=Georgenia sp. SUBG003 TaxID=1497974 RepID=UPI003AB561FC
MVPAIDLTAVDILAHVTPLPAAALRRLREGAVTVGLDAPLDDDERLAAANARRVTMLALERLPRTSRAQAMDVLSSQALAAGYRAVLEAAVRLPRFFPLAMTAAGTVPPANVVVLGVGVAGLQAIATARRLGAKVSANDIRPDSAEEVRSVGGHLHRRRGRRGVGRPGARGGREHGRGAGRLRVAGAPVTETFGPVLDDAGHELDRIRLVGVRARGHHGVHEHERREGQEFAADVVLHLDTRAAGRADDLARTVSYADVAQDVVAVLGGEPVDLVETLAGRIADAALARPGVRAVDVTVHKPQAPLTVPFDDVQVSVLGEREAPGCLGRRPRDVRRRLVDRQRTRRWAASGVWPAWICRVSKDQVVVPGVSLLMVCSRWGWSGPTSRGLRRLSRQPAVGLAVTCTSGVWRPPPPRQGRPTGRDRYEGMPNVRVSGTFGEGTCGRL